MSEPKLPASGLAADALRPLARELSEPILPDDYPVYADYLYVADGKVIRSDWHQITVRALKRHLGAKEIRRCDMVGRDRASKAEGR